MKSILTYLVFFLSIHFGISGYSQQTYFSKIYNPNNTWGACTNVLYRNDTIFGCSICGDSITNNKVITIALIDTIGEIISTNNFAYPGRHTYPGRSGGFNFNNSGFSICGTFEYPSENKGFILKLNNDLEQIWIKEFESHLNNSMIIDGGIQTSDGGFIITGELHITGYTGDVVVLKTDSLGKEEWRRLYDIGAYDRGYTIIKSNDDGYIITGYSYDPPTYYSANAFILKIDSTGDQEWMKVLGSENYDDRFSYATISSDGNIVVGYSIGTYQGPPYPVPPPYLKINLIKYKQNGELIWDKTYGQSWDLQGVTAMLSLKDGSVIATGWGWCDTIYGGTKSFILKVNAYGDSIWYRNYAYYQNMGGGFDNRILDIAMTNNGGFVFSGESRRYVPGYPQSLWISLIDSAGCSYPGCDPTIFTPEKELGDQFELTIYPNPAKNFIVIKSLIKKPWTMISFYNQMGQMVLRRERVSNIINISSLKPGLYIVEIQGVDWKKMNKLIIN